MSAGDQVRSFFNVVRKELIQTLRDRRMVISLVLAPLIQLVVFGYAVDRDVDRIPTVVCDQERSPASRALVQQFFADRTFVERAQVFDPEAAEDALESGRAAAALIVPPDFHRRRARGDRPEVQVLVDGTDTTRAQVAASTATQYLIRYGIGAPPAARGARVTLAPRVLFNERLKSAIYMVPGILATLLLNVTAIVAAMGLARERESGTLEQLLVTPIRTTVLLAGKMVPYTLFGLIDVLAVLLVGSLLFAVPLRGSFLVLGLAAFLYLFSTLGIGIFIATISASQQQAMLGAFGFVLPAMLLSGFLTPISSMPAWLRPVTLLIPMRHFIEILRACLLKGAGLGDLAPQLIALLVLGAGILAVSVARFRKRLA
jgi:ABC-2 type transport system permease protein